MEKPKTILDLEIFRIQFIYTVNNFDKKKSFIRKFGWRGSFNIIEGTKKPIKSPAIFKKKIVYHAIKFPSSARPNGWISISSDSSLSWVRVLAHFSFVLFVELYTRYSWPSGEFHQNSSMRREYSFFLIAGCVRGNNFISWIFFYPVLAADSRTEKHSTLLLIFWFFAFRNRMFSRPWFLLISYWLFH